jgi:hypothetical protein
LRIRIQEGKNDPKKLKKGENFYLLRAEGFSCSLGVLYGGLGISKLQFLIKKIKIKIPYPQLEKMLDPDSYPDPH